MQSNEMVSVRAFEPESLEVFVLAALQRATQKAALASAHARGRNNGNFADALAVAAIRETLDAMLPVGAEVVIGEGERDEAPMLYIGERLGPNKESPPMLLIAVDPLEGTNLAAHWLPGSICVLAGALVGQGTLWAGIDGYMERFIVGNQISKRLVSMRSNPSTIAEREYVRRDFILDHPIEDTVSLISSFTGKPVTSIIAEVLERPRNADLIRRLRQMHVQVRLISDGDVMSAWRTLAETGEVDFYAGIGAAPEGVLSAAMANVTGGYMEGRCWFEDSNKGTEQKRRFEEKGVETSKIHTVKDLAGGNVMIAFTAVTDGMLPGVSYGDDGVAYTATIVGRSRTGTHYKVLGTHKNPPLPPSSWPLNGN